VAAKHWHPVPARVPPCGEPHFVVTVQACHASSASPATNLPPLTTVAGLSAHFALPANRAATKDTFILQEKATSPPPPQRRPPQLRTLAAVEEGASAAPAAASAAPSGATGQHSDRQAPRDLRQDSDNDQDDEQDEELRAAGVADVAAAPAWGAAGPAPGAASVVAAPAPTLPVFEQLGIEYLVDAPAFEAALRHVLGVWWLAFIRIRLWQPCDTHSQVYVAMQRRSAGAAAPAPTLLVVAAKSASTHNRAWIPAGGLLLPVHVSIAQLFSRSRLT